MRDSGEDAIDDSLRETSPTEEKKNLKVLVLVVVAVLIVAILASAYYVMVEEKTSENGEPKCGDYSGLGVEVYSNTTAKAMLWAFSTPPSPVDLRIVLDNATDKGTYFFPSSDDGVELQLQEGTDLAEILYRDYADNGKVNTGDELLIFSLTPGDRYSLWVIWAPSNDPIACDEFSMPS